jgi:flavodoxin
MKVMVIYDSAYGNTAQIAQAISNVLAVSEDVELHQINEVKPEQLADLDVLIVGSPTQKARPTPATSDFLDSIAKNGLKGIKVAAFDTRFSKEKIDSLGFVVSKLLPVFGFAAKPISDSLKKKGGKLVIPPEGFYVSEAEGPLMEGELERAADWAQQILTKL